jgi:hypothetical protein
MALAACSDQPTSAPTAPTLPRASVPAGVNGAALVLEGSCDINQLKADARAYANRSNDVLLSIIGDLQGLVRSPLDGNTQATDKAFDGLSRMAAIRGTSDQKAGVTGAVFDRLVRGFLKCMDPDVYAGALEPEPPAGGVGFRPALGPGWVFEVRGKDATDGMGAAYERSSPDNTPPDTWWGAWPNAATWAEAIQSTVTADRVLIYGYKTNFLEIGGGKVGNSFEHRTIPQTNKLPATNPTFVLSATLGLCFFDGNQVKDEYRINHANTFLPLASTEFTCSTPTPFTAVPASSLAFGRLNPVAMAQRAAGFFMPRPLYASSAFFLGIVTGTRDDFSPSAVYDLSQVTLSFDHIDDGFINTALTSGGNPVRVWARSPSGAPIPGVDVTIRIAGNNSTISFLNGSQTSVTFPGTADGYAVLTGLSLSKAGGYQLSAEVNVAGVVGAFPFLSDQFTIQNKAAP